MDNNEPLESVIGEALQDIDGQEISLRELIELYDDRTFGACFTLLGLCVVLPPLGGIPGLPAIVALVILLFSLQSVFGRDYPWLPGFVGSLSIDKSKLKKAEEKARPVLKTIDGLITDRVNWAVSAPARYGASLIVSILAILIIPLELLPFAVAVPGAAITLIGLSLLARDGVLMLLAYTLSTAAAGMLIKFL